MVLLSYNKNMKKRVGGLPKVPAGPKVKAPRHFNLQRAALMTNTIRAQNINLHKKHAEVQAHKAAVFRAQNRNMIQNEYHNLLAASMHGPLHNFAIQRMRDIEAMANL